MPNKEDFFEIGISRHAPKVEKPGEVFDVTKQEVDTESAQIELEERARFLLKNLERAPQGTVMALESSNIKRAGQTEDLFVEKFTKFLRGNDDVEMVKLSDNEEESKNVLDRITKNPNKKFIITNLRPTWLLGFKEGDKNVQIVNKWKNKLNGNEDFLGKVWSAHPNEISALHIELKNAGFDIPEEEIQPSEFHVTPEEQVLRQVRFMKGIKDIGEKHFPGRSLILEGISHNMRSDFTSLALLEEDISVESINRVLGGRLRLPFERSNIKFSHNNVEVAYRDKRKVYTEEEFKSIINRIKDKVKMRRQEWALDE